MRTWSGARVLIATSCLSGAGSAQEGNKQQGPVSQESPAELRDRDMDPGVIGKVLSLQGEGRHWGWRQEGAGTNAWPRQSERIREG